MYAIQILGVHSIFCKIWVVIWQIPKKGFLEVPYNINEKRCVVKNNSYWRFFAQVLQRISFFSVFFTFAPDTQTTIISKPDNWLYQ